MLILMLLFFDDSLIPLVHQFQPPEPNWIAAGAQDVLYCLDPASGDIKVISGSGEAVHTISRRGPGPGELVYPTRLWLIGNHVYVHDYFKGIIRFDIEGNFIERYQLPQLTALVQPWAGSWILLDTSAPNGSKLRFIDEPGSQERNPWVYEMSFVEKMPTLDDKTDGSTLYREAALQERPLLALDPHKDRLFVYDPKISAIHCFSGKSLTPMYTMDLPFKRRPLYKEILPEINRQMEVQVNGREILAKVVIDYPDTLPLVIRMATDPWGNLHVVPGARVVDRDAGESTFNEDGHIITSEITYSATRRIVGINGDIAYVLCYDPIQEQAFVKKCSVGNLPSFVSETNENFFGKEPFASLLRPN